MSISTRDPNNEWLEIWQDFWYLLASPITFFAYIFFAIAMVIKHQVEGTVLYMPLFIVIGIPFLLVDVVYNALIGSFTFLELPKWNRGEWLYTARLQRHKALGSKTAFEHCRKLNRWDPGHC